MVDVFHGMFAANTASGAQIITGVGFSGKVVLFYSVQQTNKDGSYSGHYRYCVGMANHSGASRAISANSSDVVTNSDVGYYHSTSGCVLFCTASGTVGAQANISGFGGDGFTLRWVNQVGGFAVSGWVGFDVLGGDDIVNQAIVDMSGSLASGAQAVNGVGFSGNLAIVIGASSANSAGNTANSPFIGIATDSTHEAVASIGSRDAQNTSDTYRWPRTDRFVLSMQAAGGSQESAEFTDFHSDGINVNWTDPHSIGGMYNSLLVVKISGNVRVNSFNTTTGTGNQDIAGVGFSGKYVFLMSTDTACNNAAGASGNNRLSIGSAISSSSRGAVWAGDADASALMVNTRGTREDACFLAAIENATDSSTSGTMIADFVSFNSDGFTINKSVNAFNGDTSGMTISSLVIGDTISGAAVEVVQDVQRRGFGGGNNMQFPGMAMGDFGGHMQVMSDNRTIFGQIKTREYRQNSLHFL